MSTAMIRRPGKRHGEPSASPSASPSPSPSRKEMIDYLSGCGFNEEAASQANDRLLRRIYAEHCRMRGELDRHFGERQGPIGKQLAGTNPEQGVMNYARKDGSADRVAPMRGAAYPSSSDGSWEAYLQTGAPLPSDASQRAAARRKGTSFDTPFGRGGRQEENAATRVLVAKDAKQLAAFAEDWSDGDRETFAGFLQEELSRVNQYQHRGGALPGYVAVGGQKSNLADAEAYPEMPRPRDHYADPEIFDMMTDQRKLQRFAERRLAEGGGFVNQRAGDDAAILATMIEPANRHRTLTLTRFSEESSRSGKAAVALSQGEFLPGTGWGTSQENRRENCRTPIVHRPHEARFAESQRRHREFLDAQ